MRDPEMTAKNPEDKKGIDFTTVLLDFKGRSIKDDLEEGNPDLTLGTAARHALLVNLPNETLGEEEKWKNANLAYTIEFDTNCVLKVGEIDNIKKRIGKAYGAVVVWAAFPLLDPAYKRGRE